MARLPTRAQVRERGNRGLLPEDQAQARLVRVALAAEAAFGAGTLLEAQEAIGAAVPGIVTSITLSGNFNSPTGAAPQTTATETLTIAAGNPGRVIVNITAETDEAVPLLYSLAGAGLVSIASGDEIEADTTNTLDFTLSLAEIKTVQLSDAITGALIGTAFTITAT